MALRHTGASGRLVRNIARPETGRADVPDVREGPLPLRRENMFCNSRPCRGSGVALRQEEKHVNERLPLARRRQFATECKQGRSTFGFLDLAQPCRVWSRCSGTKNA